MHKTEKEGALPNSFCKASITLITKPSKDTTGGKTKNNIVKRNYTSQPSGIYLSMQDWFNFPKSVVTHHIKWLKKKNHMIRTIGEEKAFDTIQCQLMIKTLSKVGIEKNVLNLIKTM